MLGLLWICVYLGNVYLPLVHYLYASNVSSWILRDFHAHAISNVTSWLQLGEFDDRAVLCCSLSDWTIFWQTMLSQVCVSTEIKIQIYQKKLFWWCPLGWVIHEYHFCLNTGNTCISVRYMYVQTEKFYNYSLSQVIDSITVWWFLIKILGEKSKISLLKYHLYYQEKLILFP